MPDFLEIDGSYLEGGGQILRNALSLSCILSRSIRIVKIRANRPNPGLSHQHLAALNLLKDITCARVKGNFVKSTEVEFQPGIIISGKHSIDTRTAASISLILQAVLPVLIFGNSSSELMIKGGTNVGMAPQVDFMTEVFRPNLELFGVSFDFDLIKRGYYPRGGGCCNVTVPAVNYIKAAQITKFGSLTEVCGWCFVAGNIPRNLADDMKNAVTSEMQCLSRQRVFIEAYKESSDIARDNGSGLIIKAVSSEGCVVGASALGERKIDANAMGVNVAKELQQYISKEICVDRYVQDQLIIFMALAKGVSRISTCELADHTKTAIHVAELMLGVKFKIEKAVNANIIIECQGVGYINKNIEPVVF